MLILNFTHPLTPDQLAQVEALTGETVTETRHLPTHFDAEVPFGPQVTALVDRAGLTPTQWQTAQLLVVPPALNFIAVLVLAELHGRTGYFCPCVRLKPIAGAVPPRYAVAEVLDLQGQREVGRGLRESGE